jgi:hypothetical protein
VASGAGGAGVFKVNVKAELCAGESGHELENFATR